MSLALFLRDLYATCLFHFPYMHFVNVNPCMMCLQIDCNMLECPFFSGLLCPFQKLQGTLPGIPHVIPVPFSLIYYDPYTSPSILYKTLKNNWYHKRAYCHQDRMLHCILPLVVSKTNKGLKIELEKKLSIATLKHAIYIKNMNKTASETFLCLGDWIMPPHNMYNIVRFWCNMNKRVTWITCRYNTQYLWHMRNQKINMFNNSF